MNLSTINSLNPAKGTATKLAIIIILGVIGSPVEIKIAIKSSTIPIKTPKIKNSTKISVFLPIKGTFTLSTTNSPKAANGIAIKVIRAIILAVIGSPVTK